MQIRVEHFAFVLHALKCLLFFEAAALSPGPAVKAEQNLDFDVTRILLLSCGLTLKRI